MFDWAKGLIEWMKKKVDEIFGYFGFYTQGYSKLLVYGLLIFLAAKMLKIKLDWKVNT